MDSFTSGYVFNILYLSLTYLPSLVSNGVIQGDFLYGPGELKKQKIKGANYITFHPNTIVYAVPAESQNAKELIKSKIGIVWHTTYTGNSFESMKASYGVNVNKLGKNPNVWSQDAMLRDMTRYTMSKKETDTVNEYLSQAGVPVSYTHLRAHET